MKKIIVLVVLLLAILTPCAVSAHENASDYLVEQQNSVQVSARGLVVAIAADVYEENGYIYGMAKNTFAIGFSTVYTVVLLYSSETYTEDRSEMTYESHNAIDDLNLGKSITTNAPKTSSRWWRCVVKFKQDNQEWDYVETQTAYF